jgi:hypothetical protein
LAFASPALAQPAAPQTQAAPQAIPPAPDASTNVQSTTAQQTEPTFQLFGIRIGLAAPVPPSYEATSFNNLAGQPMTSVDQVMSQQFTGQQP